MTQRLKLDMMLYFKDFRNYELNGGWLSEVLEVDEMGTNRCTPWYVN